MFHLTDRLLAKLIDGSISGADLQRIRRHVDDCRACARRLEEWRDNFTEVDERFPELAVDQGPMATVTPGGLVMLPGAERSRRTLPDLTTMLWIGAVFMALLVGYGASRLRQPSDGMGMAAPEPAKTSPRPAGNPSRPSPRAPDTRDRAAATVAPAPSPDVPAGDPGGRRLPASGGDPSPRTPTRANAGAAPVPVSPRFRVVQREEAARHLGGPLRSVSGLTIDHIELGPASAVPGAQSGLDVIRVVYRSPEGGRLLLDQQRIPTDSDGMRSIEDPTLESGQTAYGSAPDGVSVATWLDEDGYRISLVARAPLDSLKQLVPLVQ